MSSGFYSALNYIAETKEIVAVLVTAFLSVLGFIALKIFAAKPKLRYAILDESHLLPRDNEGKTFSVFTMKALFVNLGTKMCDSVEFTLNYAPQHFEIFPHLPYSTHVNPDNRIIYTISNLNPKERFNIAMLNSHSPLPEITSVRYKGGPAYRVEIENTRKFSGPIKSLIWFLIIMGAVSVIYILVRLGQLLIFL